MTTTFTPNLSLSLQGTGDNSNSWGSVLNSSVITLVDQALGNKLSLSVAGSADVTLSTAQSQNLYFNFTGALTGNINVVYPASAGRIIIVNNATSGSFTLTIKPSGGTGFLVTQGTQQFVQIDGTANVAQAPQYDILPFEVSLASASTTNLGATGTNVIAITGTTTIASFGASASINECLYFLRFTGALTLTYNVTSLILPGAGNITTAAGDTAIAKYEGSGNWRFMMYTLAAGAANTGTVNTGSANQLAYYASSTNAVNGVTAIPNGITATTQAAADSSTKLATTAFVNGTALTLAANTTAVTQTANNNSTKVATTAYVDTNAFTTKGTFTPVLKFGGGTTGLTYTTQTAQYLQVGKLIHFDIQIALSSKGSSTGAATITGLPFSSAQNGFAGMCYFNNTAGNFASYTMGLIQGAGIQLNYALAGGVANLADTDFTNSATIFLNGTYTTA